MATDGSLAADGPGAGGGSAGGSGRRVRRRLNRWKVALFLLAGVGLVAAVAWALLGSRFFVVRSIEVTGTHLVPRSEVLAAARIPEGLPMMRVNAADVARKVERITQVESAQVTRDWPDKIVITVRERTPFLAVRTGTGFDLIDASGVVVQQARHQPPGMPLFIPAGPVLGSPGVRAAVTVVTGLPPGIARDVRSVTAPDAGAVTLRLTGGVTVDWGSSDDAAQKARVLTILMRAHARYYNVSAPGTAVTG